MTTTFSSYTGPEFLAFYLALMVAAVLAGIWIPLFLRAEGREQTVTDVDELAWLTSGATRFTDTVLARLLGQGTLKEEADGKLRVTRPASGNSPAERALRVAGGAFTVAEADKYLAHLAKRMERELIDRELVIETGSRWGLRLLGTAPYLVVLAVGWYRQQAGAALGEATGFLVMLMVVTGALALWRLIRFDPRTQAGQQAVAKAKVSAQRLQSAPTEPELGLGVALFGTAILVGTPFSQLHAMRQATSGSNSADAGGDGDGGCGGGGCGGCGG